MAEEVRFFRSSKKAWSEEAKGPVEEPCLKIEFKLPNDKFCTNVKEATAEHIEEYAAEYQLFEATEGGEVALEDAVSSLLKENKRLKAIVAEYEAWAPVAEKPQREALIEAELLEIDEPHQVKKGRK